MSTTEVNNELGKHYQAAFDAYGVPEEMRTEEHFFIDFDERNIPYAIPREISVIDNFNYGKEAYFNLWENGAVVSNSSSLGTDVEIGSKTIVHHSVKIGAFTTICRVCHIGEGTSIGGGVTILDEVKIGERSKIEGDTRIGTQVKVGQTATIGRRAHLEGSVNVGKDVVIGVDTQIGYGTNLEKLSHIDRTAKIGRNCLVMSRAHVTAGRRIRDRTIVYDGERYERARKDNGTTSGY